MFIIMNFWNLKKKAEEGLFMSDRMADKVVESCRVYIEDVEGSLLDEALQERLEELGNKWGRKKQPISRRTESF